LLTNINYIFHTQAGLVPSHKWVLPADPGFKRNTYEKRPAF